MSGRAIASWIVVDNWPTAPALGRELARTPLAELPLPYGHNAREVAGYHGTVVFGPLP